MGKNLPQTFEQMKEESMEKRRTSKIYKAEDMAFKEEQLSSIIDLTATELARVADTKDRIELKDTDTVKARTLLYMKACSQASTLPTWSGLLRSMGMTARAGYDFRYKFPDHPTSQWLEIFHDACSDALAEAANRGLTNTVFSIFIEKARNNWRDTVSIELPRTRNPMDTQITIEALEQKYLSAVDVRPLTEME